MVSMAYEDGVALSPSSVWHENSGAEVVRRISLIQIQNPSWSEGASYVVDTGSVNEFGNAFLINGEDTELAIVGSRL
jgi:hypothetical protein